MNKADYKYAVDQVVYGIISKYSTVMIECPTCSGEGVLFRKDETRINCTACKGKKELSDNQNKGFFAVEYEVHLVEVVVKKDSTSIVYHVKRKDGRHEYFDEGMLFAEKDLAQEKCDEKNSKL